MKEIISSIAISLIFVGYIPYIYNVIRRKTRPHVFTWFIWGSFSAIVFVLQYFHGGGSGSWVTGVSAAACLFIFFLSFWFGSHDITFSDKIVLICTMLIAIAWFLTTNPLLTIVLLCATDLGGFIPTIRKSWHKPHEETRISYLINTFRFALTIMALESYNVITLLHPMLWVFANGFFFIFLSWRRRFVGKGAFKV